MTNDPYLNIADLARPPRATVPVGDVRLGDGRLARFIDIWMGGARYMTADKLRLIATIDTTDRHGSLLHVSVSRARDLPSWDDIKAVKDGFFGDDRDAMMVLPRRQDYVNIMPFCLHLTECPTAWGVR